MAIFEDNFGCHDLSGVRGAAGGGMLRGSTGLGPMMLWNILQSTGQPPRTKNFPAQNISIAEDEKL